MSVTVLAVVKVTVILGVALAAIGIARRTRAAIRHVMLVVAFLAILALPVAMRLLPEVIVDVPVVRASTIVGTILPTVSDQMGQPAAVQPSTPPSGRARGSSIVPTVSFEAVLIVLWAIGVCLAILPLAHGVLELRRMRRQATPFAEGQALLDELATELRTTQPMRVAIHQNIAGPMTCGVTRPVILFSPDARQWSGADLRRAMRHELEHVRRADCLIDGLARFTCAVYWFHPLVWTS